MAAIGSGLDGASVTVPAGMDVTYYALSLLRRRRLEECIAVSSQHLRALSEQTAGREVRPKSYVENEKEGESKEKEGESKEKEGESREKEGESKEKEGESREKEGESKEAEEERKKDQLWLIHARALVLLNGFDALDESAAGPAGPAGPSATAVVDVQRIQMEKCAREKPLVARALCDYLLRVEHRPRLALELASAAHSCKSDWWWASRMGQAYCRLGLLRDAERQFKEALAERFNAEDAMWLAKVFTQMDQPLSAIEVLNDAAVQNPLDHHVLLGMARLYEQLQDTDKSFELYSRVLHLDSTNVESIACIAAHYFYEKQQPELALRLYRRLLQMGVQTTELWNNLGLSCFYSSQYDIALSCLQRAIALADTDELLADTWYNVGHVGIASGDLELAFRAFTIAVGANPRHTEALNNLAVLKLREGKIDQGKNDLTMALAINSEQHEPIFNTALLAFREGNLEEAYKYVSRSLEVSPDHPKSITLQTTLRSSLVSL